MKIEKVAKKPRTLSELCGKDPAAFPRFIQRKDASLKEMERSAREKALLARQESLSWAA
jgi:hypothetical protein